MSTKRGEDNYRMWHDKEPRFVDRLKVPLLSETHFCCIGKATEITYTSDKWEKRGNQFPYLHDFESRPKVYLAEKHVSDDEQMGRPVKTSSLLGSGIREGTLVVAFLATAKDFTLLDRDNNETELKLGSGAKMYTTPDKKTLLIITQSGPVIVRGGQMRVTSRGIEK